MLQWSGVKLKLVEILKWQPCIICRSRDDQISWDMVSKKGKKLQNPLSWLLKNILVKSQVENINFLLFLTFSVLTVGLFPVCAMTWSLSDPGWQHNRFYLFWPVLFHHFHTLSTTEMHFQHLAILCSNIPLIPLNCIYVFTQTHRERHETQHSHSQKPVTWNYCMQVL